jgi:hypothetical protein
LSILRQSSLVLIPQKNSSRAGHFASEDESSKWFESFRKVGLRCFPRLCNAVRRVLGWILSPPTTLKFRLFALELFLWDQHRWTPLYRYISKLVNVLITLMRRSVWAPDKEQESYYPHIHTHTRNHNLKKVNYCLGFVKTLTFEINLKN